MKSKRLNYKECREKVFKLVEKSNILSKQEIWDTIDLEHNMDYLHDYWRFPAFLKHTRNMLTKNIVKVRMRK